MEGLIEGRIVHVILKRYEGEAPRHRAAIVTEVQDADSGLVSLNVQLSWTDTESNDGPVLQLRDVLPDKTATLPGRWHWIEKV